jgi:predicted DNA-binding ribbon-helix-helix protein
MFQGVPYRALGMLSVTYGIFTEINNSLLPLRNLSSALRVSMLAILPSSVPAHVAPSHTHLVRLISARESLISG